MRDETTLANTMHGIGDGLYPPSQGVLPIERFEGGGGEVKNTIHVLHRSPASILDLNKNNFPGSGVADPEDGIHPDSTRCGGHAGVSGVVGRFPDNRTLPP